MHQFRCNKNLKPMSKFNSAKNPPVLTPNMALQLDYAGALSDGEGNPIYVMLRETAIQSYHRSV